MYLQEQQGQLEESNKLSQELRTDLKRTEQEMAERDKDMYASCYTC